MKNVKTKIIFLGLSFIFSTLIALLILDPKSIDAQIPDCPEKPYDIDGDDIPNSWELNEIYNDNGSKINLDLKALGADVLHKDIFLEIDYMDKHKPNASAISKVIEAFEKAPVCNPDGNPGIDLHVIVDDQIPHDKDNVYIRIVCDNPPKKNWEEFDSLKNSSFGTINERNDADASNIIDKKQLLYHYAIFIHEFTPRKDHGQPWQSRSGCADPNNLNFVISLGGFRDILGRDPNTGDVRSNSDYEAGTLMHELGHTLGLGHAGDLHEAENNLKPNYLSVMNYNFQFPSPIGNRELDYSRCAISSLNEQALNESTGIGPSCLPEVPGQVSWVGAHDANGDTTCPPDKPAKTDEPFDWDNNDNVTVNVQVIKDLDCDKKMKDIMNGYNDWANIKYIYNSYISDGDAGADLAGQSIIRKNVSEQLDIYDERTVEDVLGDRSALLKNIGNNTNNISNENIRNFYLSQLGLSNATRITIPSNATTGVVVSNATGSFSISNATGITIPSNATTGVVVSNSTDITIPISNATTGVVVSNATGIFSISNATTGVVVSNATGITIPSNATTGVVVSNATGSFSISNATGITFPSNATTGVVINNPNVKDLLESNKLGEAIEILSELEITSDSSLGGISEGDLIKDPEDQENLIQDIENFKSVIEKQSALP